ncbi:MAG: hypothetical protein ACE366_01815 [Bradymonadia bacterium]
MSNTVFQRSALLIGGLSLVALAAHANPPSSSTTKPTSSSATTLSTSGGHTTSAHPTVPSVSAGGVTPSKQDPLKAFSTVYQVLQSPRCMNCHPDGDRPLQTDQHIPHAMNISRASADNGLPCSTCHGEQNSDFFGVAGPPGAPHWGLPDKEMPLIFQGRSEAQLCAQLKDPKQNGGKTLAGLLHHVSHDPLVLWGWNPGGNRTKPPVSHTTFVSAMRAWVDAGGPCPK